MLHFYCLNNIKNSLIWAQKSNWHNRSWCWNLSLAFKHEPVHFLVAINFVINHLLLEALPAVQTAVATARPWSLFSFVPYTVSPGQEQRLQSLSCETWTKCCYFSFFAVCNSSNDSGNYSDEICPAYHRSSKWKSMGQQSCLSSLYWVNHR